MSCRATSARIGFTAGTFLSSLAAGCSCSGDESGVDPERSPAVSSRPSATASLEVVRPPRLLYLPDAAPDPAAELLPLPGGRWVPSGRCPPEMVDVDGRFCIDRYEAILVDEHSERRISPHYHPTRGQTRASFDRWKKKALRVGSQSARAMPVPAPPEWQLADQPEPTAAVRKGEIPNGYLNRDMAARACENAGKRLCSAEEWVTACRGQERRKYPYGDAYVEGECNVHRVTHPARALHNDPSTGHLDPRLNLVAEDDDPLLRPAGSTASCRSVWGADAVYDMVGNLDEWVSDPGGIFLGGFYARNTLEGCDARVEVHAPSYFDYSLGVRCCR